MFYSKKIISLFLFIFLITFLTGCKVSFKGSDNDGANNGGIFVSLNQGEVWKQKTVFPTASGIKSIAGLDVSVIYNDPNDANTLYFGSIDNGLFYSYDHAATWQLVKDLGKVTIRDLAIDPDEKCRIYVAIANMVYRTEDCSRHWTKIYDAPDAVTKINHLAVDHYDTNKVYLSTSQGEIMQSFDRGENWQTIGRFNKNIEKFAISPHDSRILFVVTERKGVFRSFNRGEEWEDISEILIEEIPKAKKEKFKNIALSKAQEDLIFLIGEYAVFVSHDYGDTWEQMNLLATETKQTINDFTVSAKSADELYYVSDTVFYRSLDMGKTWAAKKIITTRAGWRVLVNNENPNIIYMGVKTSTKKKSSLPGLY